MGEAQHKRYIANIVLVLMSISSLAASFTFGTSNTFPHSTASFHNKITQQLSASAMEVPNRLSYNEGEPNMSAFERRMRGIVLGRENKSPSPIKKKRNGSERPPNVRTVETLEEYKKFVGEEREKIVVVRFFATWCKSCKAMAPGFYRLSNMYPDINFVEVPVTDKNSELHQGLGVPSVPFGHIYHPDAGLVEELKLSKKYFAKFAHALKTYFDGSCYISDNSEDFTSPFAAEAETESKNP